MTDTAIRAVFTKFLDVPSRKVVQIILEIPSEAADNALGVLGGWPRPDESRWVALARLTEEAATRDATPPEKPKQRWAELSRAQRAGILCNSEEFQCFANIVYEVRYPEDCDEAEVAAEFVRNWCKVKSRAQFDTEKDRGKMFDMLELEYDAWRGRTARPEGRGE